MTLSLEEPKKKVWKKTIQTCVLAERQSVQLGLIRIVDANIIKYMYMQGREQWM